MKIGLSLGHSRPFHDLLDLVRHAEEIGVDSIWVSEAYGTDAVSVLGYLAAHTSRVGLGSAVLQLAARSPAATAMTAMTLDHLSAGRLLLGLGTSGPQVVRGWHGTRFDAPVARTGEYVDIVRSVVAREGPLRYAGKHYQVPYPADSDDVPPMRSSLHPRRPRVPIYLASNGPRNVALTARVAEGWLPAFWSPEQPDLYRDLLAPGLADRSPELPPLRIVATAHLAAGADLARCRDRLRPVFALYLGGMGPRDQNFYARLVSRLGYADAVPTIQDHYLAGRRQAAAAAVPDRLIDELALIGPADRIADRLGAWRASGVDVVTVKTDDRALLDRLVRAD
ncbi:LLM class F420-dependent oxidoreductase [Solwaraspora sp. WMMD1047]|uniref:LLM class F420-dependent oxidoreductase n=1 Tax=Solwaraspora sp. WMMD1047 TaxID=3016102 RepID=UPI002416D5E9|nr:LLM class F420-dependent oxidoreductase [Solwaraspora sp. WMMD1047]MDG4834384.1 LLM class F420-dependent oxidoreductase [Solwaraspora sp. WMMD1047]